MLANIYHRQQLVTYRSDACDRTFDISSINKLLCLGLIQQLGNLGRLKEFSLIGISRKAYKSTEHS